MIPGKLQKQNKKFNQEKQKRTKQMLELKNSIERFSVKFVKAEKPVNSKIN